MKQIKQFFSDEFVWFFAIIAVFLLFVLPQLLRLDERHRLEIGYKSPQEKCEQSGGIYMYGGLFAASNCSFPPEKKEKGNAS